MNLDEPQHWAEKYAKHLAIGFVILGALAVVFGLRPINQERNGNILNSHSTTPNSVESIHPKGNTDGKGNLLPNNFVRGL